MTDRADEAIDALRKIMLGQQIGAYANVREKCTGSQWKLVRFAEITRFCDEQIADLERRLKEIK